MGETARAQQLPDAAGRRAAGRLVARFSLRLARETSGATAVEYGLIVACICLAIIGGLTLFANNTNGMYTNMSATISTAMR